MVTWTLGTALLRPQDEWQICPFYCYLYCRVACQSDGASYIFQFRMA